MNELQKKLVDEFVDEDYAHGYMEGHVHDKLVAQIYWTRKARNWTQAQLAEKACMAQERISKIESGEFDSLTMTTLRKLARALDVNLNIGFEPFSHGIVAICNQTKESFVLPSRLDSLKELRDSYATVMQMYGTTPVFITAAAEAVQTSGPDSSTSSAVTTAPVVSYIVQSAGGIQKPRAIA